MFQYFTKSLVTKGEKLRHKDILLLTHNHKYRVYLYNEIKDTTYLTLHTCHLLQY